MPMVKLHTPEEEVKKTKPLKVNVEECINSKEAMHEKEETDGEKTEK